MLILNVQDIKKKLSELKLKKKKKKVLIVDEDLYLKYRSFLTLGYKVELTNLL